MAARQKTARVDTKAQIIEGKINKFKEAVQLYTENYELLKTNEDTFALALSKARSSYEDPGLILRCLRDVRRLSAVSNADSEYWIDSPRYGTRRRRPIDFFLKLCEHLRSLHDEVKDLILLDVLKSKERETASNHKLQSTRKQVKYHLDVWKGSLQENSRFPDCDIDGKKPHIPEFCASVMNILPVVFDAIRGIYSHLSSHNGQFQMSPRPQTKKVSQTGLQPKKSGPNLAYTITVLKETVIDLKTDIQHIKATQAETNSRLARLELRLAEGEQKQNKMDSIPSRLDNLDKRLSGNLGDLSKDVEAISFAMKEKHEKVSIELKKLNQDIQRNADYIDQKVSEQFTNVAHEINNNRSIDVDCEKMILAKVEQSLQSTDARIKTLENMIYDKIRPNSIAQTRRKRRNLSNKFNGHRVKSDIVVSQDIPIIAREIGSEYFDVGLALGIEDRELRALSAGGKPTKRRAMDVMSRWLMIKGNRASWDMLFETLHELQLNSMVDNLKNHFEIYDG